MSENTSNVSFETESDSEIEGLFKGIIKGYEEAFNRHNTTIEITYQMTITNHKVPTRDGNKDAAYLRLEKIERPKGSTEAGVPRLIVQQYYVFKDLKERLNPDSQWKDVLFTQALAYLIGGGLEYADLLMLTREMNTPKAEATTQERLDNLNLISADETPDKVEAIDKDYIKWLKEERAKEGI
jgi:hypothetical protein